MVESGRLVAFKDDAGQSFSFAVCSHCTGRLDRLPIHLQGRQLDSAIRNLERHPERYEIRYFKSLDAAKLFVKLEASRLRGELPVP